MGALELRGEERPTVDLEAGDHLRHPAKVSAFLDGTDGPAGALLCPRETMRCLVPESSLAHGDLPSRTVYPQGSVPQLRRWAGSVCGQPGRRGDGHAVGVRDRRFPYSLTKRLNWNRWTFPEGVR